MQESKNRAEREERIAKGGLEMGKESEGFDNDKNRHRWQSRGRRSGKLVLERAQEGDY